jgi:hypothetical protein
LFSILELSVKSVQRASPQPLHSVGLELGNVRLVDNRVSVVTKDAALDQIGDGLALHDADGFVVVPQRSSVQVGGTTFDNVVKDFDLAVNHVAVALANLHVGLNQSLVPNPQGSLRLVHVIVGGNEQRHLSRSQALSCCNHGLEELEIRHVGANNSNAVDGHLERGNSDRLDVLVCQSDVGHNADRAQAVGRQRSRVHTADPGRHVLVHKLGSSGNILGHFALWHATNHALLLLDPRSHHVNERAACTRKRKDNKTSNKQQLLTANFPAEIVPDGKVFSSDVNENVSGRRDSGVGSTSDEQHLAMVELRLGLADGILDGGDAIVAQRLVDFGVRLSVGETLFAEKGRLLHQIRNAASSSIVNDLHVAATLLGLNQLSRHHPRRFVALEHVHGQVNNIARLALVNATERTRKAERKKKNVSTHFPLITKKRSHHPSRSSSTNL